MCLENRPRGAHLALNLCKVVRPYLLRAVLPGYSKALLLSRWPSQSNVIYVGNIFPYASPFEQLHFSTILLGAMAIITKTMSIDLALIVACLTVGTLSLPGVVDADYRQLKPAMKRSDLLRRDNDVGLAHEVDLVYAECKYDPCINYL